MKATDVPVTASAEGVTAVHHPRRIKVGNKKLLVSRLIAVGLMVGFFWLIWWFFTSSPYAEPITALVSPLWDKAVTMINDPLGIDWGGILMGVAFVAISHIGMISFLFDEFR